MSASDESEKLNYYLAQIGRRDQQLQIDSQNSDCPRRSCLFSYSFSPSIIPWKKLKITSHSLWLFLALYYCITVVNLLGFDMKSSHNRVLYYSWSIWSFDAVSDLCTPAYLQEEAIQGSAELQCQQLHWSRTAARTGAAQDKMAQGQAFFIPGQRPRTNSSSFVQKSFCVMLVKSWASSKSL